MPCLLRTMTALRMKVTVHLASHSGITPIKVWRKSGIRCPLSGKPGGIWVKARSPVPVDFWVFPFSVHTVTFYASLSILTTGASVAKYMSLAPESTMHVAVVGSTHCWHVWLVGDLLLGKVKVYMSRVGLKLSV